MLFKRKTILFYPNIILCDENCYNAGVNLTSMKAICECKLKVLLNEVKDATKLVGLDYSNLIDSLSLDVVRCFKTIFQYKYFIICYGGFISIFLIIFQSICVIISYKTSMNKIRKTTLTLMANYSHLLNQKKSLLYPPRKTLKTSKTLKIPKNNYNKSNSNFPNETNKRSSIINSLISRNSLLLENNKKIQRSFSINNKRIRKRLITKKN